MRGAPRSPTASMSPRWDCWQALQSEALRTGAPRIPRFDIQNYTSIGPSNGSTYVSDDTSYTAVANLTKIAGRHSMKFGGDWRTFTLGLPSSGLHPPTS